MVSEEQIQIMQYSTVSFNAGLKCFVDASSLVTIAQKKMPNQSTLFGGKLVAFWWTRKVRADCQSFFAKAITCFHVSHAHVRAIDISRLDAHMLH